jgi:hypothetical protein
MEIELRERNESDSDEEDFFLSLASSWDDDEDDEEDWNKTTNASYSAMPSLAMNPSERTKTL